jgi:hypothetical protein
MEELDEYYTRILCLQSAAFRIFCFVITCMLVVLPPCLSAQEPLPEAAQQQLAKLPLSAQTVIRQLSTLDTLPQPQWKPHLADMPHGEATDLDNSSW